MSKYTLTFHLKQHTPIIHFQPEQYGATLRATELKPKLDRFILKLMGGEANVLDKWFVGGKNRQFPALDYKIKIQSITTSAQPIPEKFPLFFGNMHNEGDTGFREKQFKQTHASLSVEVFCLHADLLTKIGECFQEFIFKHNFGSRQGKGFGSFTVTQGGETDTLANLRKFKVQANDSQQLFAYIELFYKTLRSGCNGVKSPQSGRFERDFYAKPLIFAFAKQDGVQWEKKAIKQTYYPRDLSDQQLKHGNPDVLTVNGTPHIVKDLLGLSSAEAWKLPYKKAITKESISGDIDRFKSPITFKPVKVGNRYEVYVLLDIVPAKFLQSEFAIKSNSDNRLKLSVWNGFDLQRFWDFALATNWDSYLTPQYANHPIATIIKQMYKDLNEL